MKLCTVGGGGGGNTQDGVGGVGEGVGDAPQDGGGGGGEGYAPQDGVGGGWEEKGDATHVYVPIVVHIKVVEGCGLGVGLCRLVWVFVGWVVRAFVGWW
jgi:hypothetical protein